MNAKQLRLRGKFYKLLIFITLSISFTMCGPKVPSSWPPGGNCAITLDNFLENCYTTRNGTTLIDYDVRITIYYFDPSSRKTEYSSANYSSSSSSIKQPITINATIPTNVPYEVEVTVAGKQCSTCANGWGGTSNNLVDNCPTRFTPTGGVIAAFPRFYGTFGPINVYKTAMTIERIPHYFNIDNSCGCVVN